MTRIKEKVSGFYERNEAKVDLVFFLGGFILDVFTLSEIDDPISIVQQVIYLMIIGSFLYFDLLTKAGKAQIPSWFQKVWEYRQLAVHFFLGSLLSIYSLFFLKSSSIFSSILFVLVLAGLMVANELKIVKESQLNVKWALFVVCLFSFLSTVVPVAFGFVGLIPFVVTLILSGLLMFVFYWFLKRRQEEEAGFKQVLLPSLGVLTVLLVFYIVGILPPVPLSVKKMGVYHQITKEAGTYILHYDRPWWKFWQSGAQEFVAEPGDKIYFFASIYSPARFADTVYLRWSYKEKKNWTMTDRIPIKFTGGRKEGFRGFGVKEKYSDGQWRVSVETTDGRELGRLYFQVKRTDHFNPEREFKKEMY